MSRKRQSSKQAGAEDGADRTRNAAIGDAAALVTTTGAMLLGVLAGDAEAQRLQNAPAPVREGDDAPGASTGHDAPQDGSGHDAPLVPIDGAAQGTAAPPAPDPLGKTDAAPPLPTEEAAQPTSATDAAADRSGEAGGLHDRQQSNDQQDGAAAGSAAHSSSAVPDNPILPNYATGELTPTGAPSYAIDATVGALSATQNLTTALTSGLQPAGNLVQGTLQVGEDLVNSVTGLTNTVTDQVAGTLGTVTSTLGNVTGAIGDVTDTLGNVTGTLGDVSNTLGSVMGALGDVSGAPGNVAGTLGNAVGSIGGAVTNSSQPAAETATPALLDSQALVPEPVAPIQVEMAPLQLGFIGQSYADAGDPHDGAFSAVGTHGFV